MAENEYFLNRDVVASTRLNAQHYMFKEALGYNLHPLISIHEENGKIAEVGTGTG